MAGRASRASVVAVAIIACALTLAVDSAGGRRFGLAVIGWAFAFSALAVARNLPGRWSVAMAGMGLGLGLALSRLPAVETPWMGTLLNSFRAIAVLAGLACAVRYVLLSCHWRRTAWVWAPPMAWGALLVTRFWLAPDGTGVLAVFVNVSGAALMASALALVIAVSARCWIRERSSGLAAGPGAWLVAGLAAGLGPVAADAVWAAIAPEQDWPGRGWAVVTLVILPWLWGRAAPNVSAEAQGDGRR